MNVSSAAHEVVATARGLARRPGVPATIVLVVAVGVAFLVSAFGILDALIWRELPYGPHARYMMTGETTGSLGGQMPYAAVDLYEAYADAHARGRLPAAEAIIPLRERDANLTADDVTSREVATRLLPESFAHLQTAPILGRYPADPDGGGRIAREVAIGERLWQRRFGGRADVLGTRVALDGEQAVIVGVMPAAFQFHRMSQLWVAWSRAEIRADSAREIALVVRLAPGADRGDFVTQAAPVRRAVFDARTPPDTLSRGYDTSGPHGMPLVPPQLAQLVLGMVLLVLVAGCLNVATLHLARLRRRTSDYATRQALGAGPGGVMRLILTEILLLVAAGGALAVVVALAAIAWSGDMLSRALPLWVDFRLDGRGVAVALAALALALVVVAVPAALVFRRLDLARLLTHHGLLGRAPKHGRGASALIAIQVAIVVVLAAAAAPIALSAWRLADVTSGLDDDRVLQVDVNLGGERYTDEAARDRYVDGVRRSLAADPRLAGVARVGKPRAWRAGETTWSDTVYTDAGADPLPLRDTWRTYHEVVSPGYFAVVGLRIVAGEGFPSGLGAGDERVAVLSADVARRFWPGQAAVGRRFRRGGTGEWVRVIGVAEDQRGVYANWTGTTLEPRQLIYVSDAQVAAQGMHLLVRAHQATPGLAHDVRQSVERVDPTQSVTRVRLLADDFALPRVERQWIALILGSGAAVAVLLAMIGVFGLVSYYTAARLPELALRVALGAPARTLAWLVARGTLRSVAIGVAVASLLLWLVQRFVQRFAYETSALSPTVLAAVALLVATVAMVALVVPLRRVRRLSPQELLRAD